MRLPEAHSLIDVVVLELLPEESERDSDPEEAGVFLGWDTGMLRTAAGFTHLVTCTSVCLVALWMRGVVTCVNSF